MNSVFTCLEDVNIQWVCKILLEKFSSIGKYS